VTREGDQKEIDRRGQEEKKSGKKEGKETLSKKNTGQEKRKGFARSHEFN